MRGCGAARPSRRPLSCWFLLLITSIIHSFVVDAVVLCECQGLMGVVTSGSHRGEETKGREETNRLDMDG